MHTPDPVSRRTFLAMAAAAPFAATALTARQRTIPIGLELYSVRQELTKDLMSTVTAVGKMGYQVVEFYSPYYSGRRTTRKKCVSSSTTST